jgi:hypothetical protein
MLRKLVDFQHFNISCVFTTKLKNMMISRGGGGRRGPRGDLQAIFPDDLRKEFVD